MQPEEVVVACRGALRRSVIVLHGYSSHGRVHHDDGQTFVDEHTEVVLPDAPGHGAREDGRITRIGELPDEQRHAAIVAIAREWVGELPALVARCRSRGSTRIAVVGISMGGFAALGSLADSCPFDAVAAVLAAPTLLDGVPQGPPVLLGLAGRDQAVPPEPGRRFARDYGAELHEYPDSEHFMREADWHDLWARTAAFVMRHLAD